MNTAKWTAYFQKNQLRRPPPRWAETVILDPTARAALTQSLREFQLGDGGGPATLIAWNAAAWRKGQPGLDHVVELWFNEEKEHSRLLGELLRRFEVSALSSHWSFRLFCLIRRLLGVQFELQVLTLTELASTAYYRLLRQYGRDPALIDVCNLILRDESGHVAFQGHRLASQPVPTSGFGGWIWRGQFWVYGLLAATVLWISHGKCLRQLGATTGQFYREVGRQLGRFVQRLPSRRRDFAGVSPRPNLSSLVGPVRTRG